MKTWHLVVFSLLALASLSVGSAWAQGPFGPPPSQVAPPLIVTPSPPTRIIMPHGTMPRGAAGHVVHRPKASRKGSKH